MELLAAAWGNFYLIQRYHIANTQASFITSMIFLGIILGSPIVGVISDLVRSRKLPMICGAFLSLVSILAIIYTPNHSVAFLALLFLILGVVTSAQVISYSVIFESNPQHLMSTAMGIAAVFINIIGAVSQSLYVGIS